MSEKYQARADDVAAPVRGGFAITASDSTDLATETRAIHVGGASDVVAVLASGDELTFVGLAGGTVQPVRARRLKATAPARRQGGPLLMGAESALAIGPGLGVASAVAGWDWPRSGAILDADFAGGCFAFAGRNYADNPPTSPPAKINDTLTIPYKQKIANKPQPSCRYA